ncbi:hypothetical protein [Streptomyces sp. NPDC088748]|uniref:hypothetical protein n=1 Tax=Streptomyces sp. NPDC088748 TaxID=3365887 RepID=UPI00380DA016
MITSAGGLVDSGDGVEQVEGAAKGCHSLLDASGELVNHRRALVVLVQMQPVQERVVLAKASGQGLGVGNLAAGAAFGQVRGNVRVGFTAD